jgi:hypothetical protein
MPKSPAWLSELESNVHSQCGEDGVIQEVLHRLPDHDKWCVEFGAWDGEYLSNTCNLIDKQDYSAVLIEGSAQRCKDLRKRHGANPKVIGINQFVGFTPPNTLDDILSQTPIPVDFDFLSIDIDGNDYHVWKAVSRYRPKVVCVEFNPTIPTEVRFVQPADPAVSQGSSVLSLVELGKEKGYEVVWIGKVNALFVRSEYYPRFEIDDNRPAVLRTQLMAVTYIFSAYDGTVFLAGRKALIWHGLPMRESAVQQLPKFLRKCLGNYRAIHWVVYFVYWAYVDPRNWARKVWGYLKSRLRGS